MFIHFLIPVWVILLAFCLFAAAVIFSIQLALDVLAYLCVAAIVCLTLKIVIDWFKHRDEDSLHPLAFLGIVFSCAGWLIWFVLNGGVAGFSVLFAVAVVYGIPIMVVGLN